MRKPIRWRNYHRRGLSTASTFLVLVAITLFNSSCKLDDSTLKGTHGVEEDTIPFVQFSSSSQVSVESVGSITIPVTLSNAPAVDVTFPYTVTGSADGTDHNLASGTLTILAGQTTANLVITINNDSDIEINETIIITLGSSPTVTAQGTITYTVSIVDNDAAAFTWIGLGADANWSNPDNWGRGEIPGNADLAIFDDSCTQCNATINENISVSGIRMASTYTGTITQASTFTLTVGADGFTQEAGTFHGGDAAIEINGAFDLAAGTFRATSDTMTVNQSGASDIFKMEAGATFTHNNGTVVFDFANTGSIIRPKDVYAFNNVTFQTTGASNLTVDDAGALQVDGTLTFSSPSKDSRIILGTGNYRILARGDVVLDEFGMRSMATGATTGGIKFEGTAAQSISCTNCATSEPAIPGVIVDKSGGSLTLNGTLYFSECFAHDNGTVVTTGTDVIFKSYVFGGLTGGSHVLDPGTVQFNNVTIDMSEPTGSTHTYQGSGTLTVLGDFTLKTAPSLHYLYSQTFDVHGNVVIDGGSLGGHNSAKIRLVGTNVQTFTTTSTLGTIPSVEIAKTGGSVDFSGTYLVFGSFIYTSGTATGTNLDLEFGRVSSTLQPGPIAIRDLTYNSFNTATNTVSGTVSVTGDLLLNGFFNPQPLNGGTIEVEGNVDAWRYAYGGTTVIRLVGNNSQTVTGQTQFGNSPRFGPFEIDKPFGSVTFTGDFIFQSHFIGSPNAPADALGANVTFHHNGAVNLTPEITYFNNVTFTRAGDGTTTLTGTLSVEGNLTLNSSGGTVRSLNGGTIQVEGNVTATNDGYSGTAAITITGVGVAGTLSAGASSVFPSGQFTINRGGGGSVTVDPGSSTLNFMGAGQNFFLAGGTLFTSGKTINVGNNLLLNGGTTLNLGGGPMINYGGSLIDFGCTIIP